FKISTVFSGLRELCPIDVYCRILRIFKASDEITLEDIVNECINLGIKRGSDMNQQNTFEHNYVSRFSTETVLQNVSTPRKPN
ncbi:unnamed protein product, partial [Hymenolepis diminuta]